MACYIQKLRHASGRQAFGQYNTRDSTGPGAINVLIGALPAWRTLIDQYACPGVNITGIDGIGPVLMGSPTVFINNQQACRLGDIVIEKPGLALGPWPAA